tara:strand:- start:2167 stop:3012 length:846 start_codon:yes stop_codon:yes gene_type:complete
MVNSWSLLFDELKMNEHSKYYYDYDRNDPNRKNPFIKKDDGRDEDGRYPADHPSQDFWNEDGFSLTGNPSPPSSDTISFDFGRSDEGITTFGAAQQVPMESVIGGQDTLSFDMNSSDMDFISANGGFEYTPLPAKDDMKVSMQTDNWIYESPDGGKTVTRRRHGDDYTKKEVIVSPPKEETVPHFWKFEEDLTLKEVREYLSGTYKSHYTSKESKTQTLDLIESIGDAEAFTRSNAIKYLSRFGKKEGKSKLDILKAIHYCILLYHFAGLHNANENPFETF